MILPRNVEKEEEFLNVALGNVSFSQHGQLSTMYILCSRRDKVFCHDCRFCCTLSLCTNQHGTYFRESSDKNLTGSKNKAFGARAGYSLDMELYKKPDFRCLKPKPDLPSSKWPHYDMGQFRAAKTKEELQKVEEIPFNKETFLFSSLTEYRFDNVGPPIILLISILS